MRGLAFLLLPVLGILAFDPLPPDDHAVKYAALGVGALACLLLRRRFAWTDLSLALALFVAVRGVMLLHAPVTGRALRWWLLLASLALVLHAAPHRWLRRNAPLVLGPLGLLVAAIAVVQVLGGGRQAHATFANRNFAGAGIAMLLPFALATGWRWLFLAGALAGLFATGSRGGLLAAAAALALFFTWQRPRLRIAALVALPAVVLAAGLLLGDENTVKVRLHWYEQAVRMGAAHPALGVGADGFAREYPPVRPLEEHAISGGRFVHAVHDDYLESFAEGGLLGLGAHLVLLVAAARAARRSRVAAASLLAFAVASLVDLPLRDPSLLALAFLALATVARPGPRVRAPLWLVPAVSLWFLAAHWRADRAYGAYLRDRDAAHLEAALRWEPGHPGALFSHGDWARYLEQRPHDAGARYNATKGLPPEEAVAELWTILKEHDPHHVLTRTRLADLVREEDPLQAIALLEGAIAADPRQPWPWVERARIEADLGRYDDALRSLRQAQKRSPFRLADRFLEVDLARFRADGRMREGFAEGVPPITLRERAEEALSAAAQLEAADPAPRVAPVEGETPLEYAKRIEAEKAAWRRRVEERTRRHYQEAALLTEALVRREPSVESLRLRAAAMRGLGEIRSAAALEGQALFLETLAALQRGDETRAGEKWKRALRAFPGLADQEETAAALRAFAARNPDALEAARRLFAPHRLLAQALG